MGYIEEFIGAILENSLSDNYDDAIQEWTYHGEQHILEDDEIDYCCCGHAIKDVRTVRNSMTHAELTVGNCCIKKFEIQRRHFNGSREAYLALGLLLATDPEDIYYLNTYTSWRIENGRQFSLYELYLLEKITGKTSRFKPEITKDGYLEYAIKITSSNGIRDYLLHETTPRLKEDKKFNVLDLVVLKRVTGIQTNFKPTEHSLILENVIRYGNATGPKWTRDLKGNKRKPKTILKYINKYASGAV